MPALAERLAAAAKAAEIALARLKATPAIDSDGGPTQWEALQVAERYTFHEIKQLLHRAELEAWAANYLGDFDAPYRVWQVRLLARALKVRGYMDPPPAATTHRPGWINYKALKASLDIVAVIEGYTGLRKSGRSFVGKCIFYRDVTPSLVVWPEIQGFKCYGCGVKGDVITFQRLLRERGIPGGS